MKKTIAFLLAMMMLTGLLAGCGGDDPIVGTWEASMDIADQMNQQFVAAGMGDYIKLDSFAMVLRFTFTKEGTYSCVADADALAKAVESMKTAVKDGLTAFAQDAVDQAKEAGMGELTVDDVFAAAGMTLDEMMEQISSEDEIKEMAEEMTAEGNYKTGDGKLYISDSLEHVPDDNMYHNYTIEGDTLTIVDIVGGDESDAAMYPMTLKKVG